MTFSIVAFCPRSGEVGVGVATCHLCVGGMVPHVLGGVGAVASQAESNPMHGVRGLTLMGAPLKLPASEAIALMRHADEDGVAGTESRQVHCVDTIGGADGWTGTKCQPWAGHMVFPASNDAAASTPAGSTGSDGSRAVDGCGSVTATPRDASIAFSVAGNMLAGPQVLDEMAKAFRANHALPLAERLLCSLEAGQAAGGDKRGRMSAGIKVAARGQPYCYVDLRVDHHSAPLEELRRLLTIRRQPWAADFYDSRPRARL